MNKAIYYLTPFIVYPIYWFVFSSIFDKIKYNESFSIWLPIIFIVLVTLASIIISLFSKSKNKIDITHRMLQFNFFFGNFGHFCFNRSEI